MTIAAICDRLEVKYLGSKSDLEKELIVSEFLNYFKGKDEFVLECAAKEWMDTDGDHHWFPANKDLYSIYSRILRQQIEHEPGAMSASHPATIKYIRECEKEFEEISKKEGLTWPPMTSEERKAWTKYYKKDKKSIFAESLDELPF